jgi:hypothetical protein
MIKYCLVPKLIAVEWIVASLSFRSKMWLPMFEQLINSSIDGSIIYYSIYGNKRDDAFKDFVTHN